LFSNQTSLCGGAVLGRGLSPRRRFRRLAPGRHEVRFVTRIGGTGMLLFDRAVSRRSDFAGPRINEVVR
jgi:hypothetical protein